MPIHVWPGRRSAVVSRRRFLAGALGAGAAAALGCDRRVGSEGNPAGWYAWLSDTHVSADRAATMHGQVMHDNLRAVVADIAGATDRPRGILVDGDMALHDGQPGDYRAFLDAFGPCRRVPLHLALGNHDDRANVRAALGRAAGGADFDRVVSSVRGPGIRYLMLDSLIGTNVTGGELGESQIAWVANALDEDASTPTIVFVHHNLNAERASALHDTEALLGVLRPRAQAKAVVFGHTHVWNVQKIDGIYAINLPAVGYKFLRKQPLGWCAFRPTPTGGELELRCVGGDTSKDRRRTTLTWRSA